MRHTWALLILLFLAPLSAQTAAKNKKAQKAKPAAMDTMTGCVDEKTAQYILRTDDNLKELATLEPVGFEATNFARFVGHKVSVSGKLMVVGGSPFLRVSSLDHIKNISDTCAPADAPPPPTPK